MGRRLRIMSGRGRCEGGHSARYGTNAVMSTDYPAALPGSNRTPFLAAIAGVDCQKINCCGDVRRVLRHRS